MFALTAGVPVSKFHIALKALAVTAALTAASASAGDDTYVITLKNHAFSPQVVTVPAGKKIRLTIKNQDPTPAEFESNALNREKIVGANAETTIFIGPLKAGSYGFYDDFHKATTTGRIEAK
jgi:plastocyanin